MTARWSRIAGATTWALWTLTAAAQAPAAPQAIDFTLAGGKGEEICVKLGLGQVIEWSFSADAEIDFNLHQHVGEKVQMPVDMRAVRQHLGRHVVERANDWCLMWTVPKGRAVPVRVRGQWAATRAP